MFSERIKGGIKGPVPRPLPEGRQHCGHVEAFQHFLQLLTAFFSQHVACSQGTGRGSAEGGAHPAGRDRGHPTPTIEVQFLQFRLVCHGLSNGQSSLSLDLTERQVQLLKDNGKH